MKKKDICKLLIIIGIFILGYCLVKFINYKYETEIVDGVYTQKDLDIIEEDVNNYLSDKVTPKGLSKLYGNYKGENDLNDMYRSLYKFVNYLPTLSKKVEYTDSESISTYYEKNKEDIKINLGITNIEDFIKFIKFLDKVKYNGEKFLECKLDSSTFKNGAEYFSFDVIFYFEEFENEFKLNLNFANYVTTNPMIYYSIIEDNIE